MLASFSSFIILRIFSTKEAHELTAGNWQLSGVYSIGNWLVFALIGFIFMFFMNRKTNKDKKVYSHLDGHFKSLWTVTAASFFIATILCVKLQIDPPAIMLLIAGIATTTSGLLIKFRPVTIGGMTFFVFSIAASFVSNEYVALIVAGAIICGYLIPGYFLKSAKE